jgi:hypothetical protein
MEGDPMQILMLAVSLALVVATTAAAELTLFEHDNFAGRRFMAPGTVNDLAATGFNDKASSVVVGRGTWQLCDDAHFRGHCVTLQPGEYPSLRRMGLNDRVSSVLELGGGGPPPSSRGGHEGEGGRAVLYEGPHFSGRSYVISSDMMRNLADAGFNDRAASLRVEQGDWMFCSDADFHGECLTYGPGEYPNLPPQLNHRISSARRVAQRSPSRQSPSRGGR